MASNIEQKGSRVELDGKIVRVPTGTWQVDPAHSNIEFEIKHLKIATVRGRFREFEGTIVAADDIADSRVSGVVKAASIDTNEPTRDAHLRSADFFDTDHYPEIRFESKRIEPLGGPRFRVVGDLTMKGVTRQVELAATVEGVQEDPFGHERLGLSARGTINRTDFGLTWQHPVGHGGFLLGDEVRIVIDVSAIHAS
ncbi:MAG: YceI family protein [Gaiellaceae bacterium]